MEQIKLNETDILVSKLSLGTWAFSNASVWGECDEYAAIRTIHDAMERGINLFDSAEKYGGGQAEEVLGKALRDRRSNAIIATKVYSDHLHYQDLVESCERSMRRMQTDYLDILQIHWPNPDIPVEETFSALEALKKAGKIRAVSVCNHGPKCFEKIAEYPISFNQMAYSLLWRLSEDYYSPLMEKKGVKIWAYSPLAQGLLTGKFNCLEDVPVYRRANRMYDSRWKQGRHSDRGFEDEIFTFLNSVRSLLKGSGYTITDLAFSFLKNKSNVGSILVGARDIHQLEYNLKAYERDVDSTIMAEVEELSLGLKNQMGNNPDMWENDLNPLGGEGRIY